MPWQRMMLDCRHDRYTLRSFSDRVSASGTCLCRVDGVARGRTLSAADRGSGSKSRTREEFVAAILEDLAWLGLTWEEPVLRQSTRFDAYRRGAGCVWRPSPIPVSAPARRSPRKSRARSKRRMRRWVRMVRSIPAPAATFHPTNAMRVSPRGESFALAAGRRQGRGGGGAARLSSSMGIPIRSIPCCSAMWCWRARICRPPIIWRWWWMTHSRASIW